MVGIDVKYITDIGKKFGETEADIKRKIRSIKILNEKNIPYMPELYVIIRENEAKIRSKEEIAERLFAVFAVSVYSEVRGSGETWESSQKYLNRIDEILEGELDNALTDNEKFYLSNKRLSQQEIINFSWHYERCYVLLWALGFVNKLPFPDNICDASAIGKIIWNQESLIKFSNSVKMKTKNEIIDAADLNLRYDWACVDARINNRENPAGLNGGITYERSYTFNWLIGANDNADWDNILPGT